MNRIVPVYPWPMHPVVKEQLDAIEGITVIEALPGIPGPILAINQVPEFAVDAIVVRSPEHIPAAIKIVTSNGIELHTVRDMISAWMGSDQLREKQERKGPVFK